MPVYVYRCKDCDYTFEARQRMNDEPLTECPSCPEGQVRRVINNVGVVFKGSGFYVTDSRKKDSKISSSTSSNGSKSTEDKTESKPEKKTEKKTESST